MRRSVRAYRTLLWLYPPSFRREYGDHMVAVFEDMLRDDPAAHVWSRVVVDAARSIPIQHTEAVMATRFSPNTVGLLGVLFFAIGMSGIAIGGFGHWWFSLPALGSLAASGASLLYWRSHWQYVEDTALHHRWFWFVAGGGALLGSLVAGTALDLSLPWEVLIGIFFTGWTLLGVGVLLGLWNGFVALRHRGDNGVWPAS
jgi:hypothetical protein